MTSRKQHPAKLRERAVAMVFELRAESGSTRGSLASVGHKLGINPETLRNWVEKAEVDSGQRPGRQVTDPGENLNLAPDTDIRFIRLVQLVGG